MLPKSMSINIRWNFYFEIVTIYISESLNS
jgi:hypothetical protein